MKNNCTNSTFSVKYTITWAINKVKREMGFGDA